MTAPSCFDQYAATYDSELNQALSLSGEDKTFFAARRVDWLRHCLRQYGEHPRSAIDYGCGLGDTTTRLQRELALDSVIGLDVSDGLLEQAQKMRSSTSCRFMKFDDYSPAQSIDLVYCNGVFHHIPVAERRSALDYIFNSLRPGGIFALWENNPWNPGTRYVMARCSFDRDAIPINPLQARHLLRTSGFELLQTDYLFFFPGWLKVFRRVERYLHRVPAGAQYQVLCRKPMAARSKMG